MSELNTLESNSTVTITNFLNELQHLITTDKMLIEGNVMDEKTVDTYLKLASGEVEKVLEINKDAYLKYLFTNLAKDYIDGLKSMSDKPLKLAINFNNSEMLIWVEIKDDNEKLEDDFLLLQARLNAKYSSKGANVKTTIVEKSDYLAIPPQYSRIN